MSLTDVCELADLADATPRRFVVGGQALSLVRVGDDVYAIGDVCSHADFSLSEGEFDADSLVLECWKHGAGFELETGNPTCLPATKPVPSYPVTVVNGQVKVDVT